MQKNLGNASKQKTFEQSKIIRFHVFLEKVQQIRGTVSSTMFGGDRGEISSPNFPDRYALNDETFTYILTNLDPYGKIRIIFDDWDLASVSTLQV